MKSDFQTIKAQPQEQVYGEVDAGKFSIILEQHCSFQKKKRFLMKNIAIAILDYDRINTEKRAAWSLFVELVTRITIQPLESKTDQGLLREALKSLHSLFGTTREIIKQAGPDIGISHQSVGGIAITILNQGLRPFLSKWHPLLQSWEAQRPFNISPFEHEQNWQYEEQLRSELETLRHNLEEYAIALAVIAGVDYCV